MTTLVKCESCSKQDIFVFRVNSECECSISEDKACRITDLAFKKWSKSPVRGWSSIQDLLSILSNGMYADDFIFGRDKYIEDHVVQAIKYLFGRDKLRTWEYLDIGCGTYIPTLNIAQLLGTYPLGVDYIDRRKCNPENNYFVMMKDAEIPFGDVEFRFITMCDILHHVSDPETMVDKALESLSITGSILIMDHDCESWEDSYYLDLLHLVYAKAVGETSGDYLPTYGYRSRRFWRCFMRKRGYEIVYDKLCQDSYQTYIDVYQKAK